MKELLWGEIEVGNKVYMILLPTNKKEILYGKKHNLLELSDNNVVTSTTELVNPVNVENVFFSFIISVYISLIVLGVNNILFIVFLLIQLLDRI